MPTLSGFRAFWMAMIAAIGLSLGACNPVSALTAPTYEYVVQVDAEAFAEVSADSADADASIERAMDVLSLRMGTIPHRITRSGERRIVIEISAHDSRALVESVLGIGGDLDFKLVDGDAFPSDIADEVAPPGREILPMADGSGSIVVRRLGGIRGEHVINALTGIDPDTNEHVINLQFDDAGAAKLATLTQENVGNPMAIVLDGEVLSAPIIYEPIVGGALQISGNFTSQAANDLAIAMKSGALPVPLKIVAERQLD